MSIAAELSAYIQAAMQALKTNRTGLPNDAQAVPVAANPVRQMEN